MNRSSVRGCFRTQCSALVLLVAALSSSAAELSDSTGAPQRAPNVLLILLDDVGFGDTSTFGGAAHTPVLTRLAADGLRYNRFHTVGICAPTRAALLSGRNSHRMGFGSHSVSTHPGYDHQWRVSTASIAEVLRRNGYSTAAFGKWHNTPAQEISPIGPFDRWPTGLGFEYYYGNMMGMSSQWEPPLWRNTVAVQAPRKPAQEYHLTTDLVDDAIRWIQTHQTLAEDKPYFVYFATGAAHVPHHVPKQWIDRYRGQFDQGWDRLREEIFARQKRLGVIPGNATLTPRPSELPAWSSLSAKERQLFARQMEVYAAFIAHTDDAIGRLIEAVRDDPEGENTLILYVVGDNGGEARALTGYEDNASARKSIDARLESLEHLGSKSYMNTYAAGWAWAGSTPFQWMKPVASHFGATRNPLIVSWPARIKQKGGVCSQFTHVNDIAGTVYDVAGIQPPATVDGVPQEPLDGVSFGKTFDTCKAPTDHRVQYFEVYGNRAIYSDGWFASARHEVPWRLGQHADFAQDRWELYNLELDFSQARDVAARYPEKLREMRALFDTEAHRNDVYPLAAMDMAWSPGNANSRARVYHQGFSQSAHNAPAFGGSSFSVVAEIAASAKTGADGTILAYGGRNAGFALYVKDDHVVYEVSEDGKNRKFIRDSQLLAGGNVVIRYEYAKDSNGPAGRGSLYVDGRLVGTVHLERGLPFSIDNFDVGQDSASPVSNDYEAPFPFAGDLRKVTVSLGLKPTHR